MAPFRELYTPDILTSNTKSKTLGTRVVMNYGTVLGNANEIYLHSLCSYFHPHPIITCYAPLFQATPPNLAFEPSDHLLIKRAGDSNQRMYHLQLIFIPSPQESHEGTSGCMSPYAPEVEGHGTPMSPKLVVVTPIRPVHRTHQWRCSRFAVSSAPVRVPWTASSHDG